MMNYVIYSAATSARGGGASWLHGYLLLEESEPPSLRSGAKFKMRRSESPGEPRAMRDERPADEIVRATWF